MKILSICTFLFLFCCEQKATAQVSVNVYWTTTNTLKPTETIYYDINKKLIWSDFSGQPKPSGNEAALTASGFGFKTSMKSSSDKKTGEINIGIYCYFSKPNSWVIPGHTSGYVLKHEQLHFDISYLATLYFMQRVKTEKITISNLSTLLPALYKEACDYMNKMQDDYDTQSRHGINTNLQAKWETEIAARLIAAN